MTEEVLLAYAAGLLDGEGSLVIGCGLKADRPSPSYWLQVDTTNTDRALIDRLHEHFGGHISDHSHAPSRRRQRPCWAWRVISRDAPAFLRRIQPFVRVKAGQIVIALEFQNHMSTSRKSPYRVSADELAIREQYRGQLRALTTGATKKLGGGWSG